MGTYIASLLPALTKEFDVLVAAHGPGPLEGAALAAGARFVPLRYVRRPVNWWYDLAGFVELLLLCRRERPAIVHANSSKAGFLSRVAAALAGVRIRIFSVHGWAFTIPGISRLALWADRAVAVLTTTTICVATCDRELGAAARTCVRESTVVISNGIDASRFTPSLHQARETPVLASVGRVCAQKDYTTFVRALARLEQGSFRALIVGSGPQWAKIAAEIERLQLTDSVQLCGERQDVRPVLASADAFVLASAYESLPISILEAMAARLPVVASAVGGVPDIVVDGETGFLVPPADPEALADRLRTIVADGALRRRLGDAGRRRVEKHFAVEEFQRLHVELYRRELARIGVARPAATAEAVRGPAA